MGGMASRWLLRAGQDDLQARHRHPVAADAGRPAATAPAAPRPAASRGAAPAAWSACGAPAPRRPAAGCVGHEAEQRALGPGVAERGVADLDARSAASCPRARDRRRSARPLALEGQQRPRSTASSPASRARAPTASLALARAQPRHLLRPDAEHARQQHRVIVDAADAARWSLRSASALLVDAGELGHLRHRQADLLALALEDLASASATAGATTTAVGGLSPR